nr:zincin-like metallopeptidase domain-containing protein [uncultured Dyadobacter sp.]
MKATKTYSAPSSFTSYEKNDVYEVITNRIIQMIEEGVNPWKKTWENVDSDFSGPVNFISGRPYTGINFFVLSCSPYSFPYFMTMKQVNEKGGRVKAGEKATPVVFAKSFEKKSTKETADGEKVITQKGFCYKLHWVFNIEQTNLPLPEIKEGIENENLIIEQCENVIVAYKNAPAITHVSNSAYYSPSIDTVNMPKMHQFINSSAYYATLFHELIHSTGSAKRLGRDGVVDFDKFGSERYSNEELIAELGAAFLNAFTGITNPNLEENTAAYLTGWLKPLKNDKKFVFKAAAAAQKAVNYMLGKQEKEQEE